MKELVIPKDIDNTINIVNITPSTPCLIIAYYADKPVFYIQYCAGDWCAYNTLNQEECIENEFTLIDLIHVIEKKEQKSFTYKVIEFNE